MNTGKLDKRVIIQEKRVVIDPETFLPVEAWVDFDTVWAAVEPIRGREYFAAAAVNAESTIRVRIRYRKGITSDMRVKYGDRLLEIISPPIDPEEKHVEIHLMTKEIV